MTSRAGVVHHRRLGDGGRIGAGSIAMADPEAELEKKDEGEES